MVAAPPSLDQVASAIAAIAAEWAGQRAERQRRRTLDPADFARLAEAGFLLTGVPVEEGGLIDTVPAATRAVCDLLRTLAHADSSVALVAAMHPAVLYTTGWLPLAEAPAPHAVAWSEQRRWVFATARAGHWWGTITSEPGSGGDMFRTRTRATPAGAGGYTLSGDKHFGSGSGITSFVMTTAVVAGEPDPDIYVVDMRGVPWDGSTGVTLTAPWDGMGMIATQSHAFHLENVPATRMAWPDLPARRRAAAANSMGFLYALFSAVIVGIAEEALTTANRQLAGRADLRPYEQVEWARARVDGWLIAQAYEGLLRSVAHEGGQAAATGKLAIAELAETLLGRLGRVIGGGAFARSSPFGCWYEDVRALGFLRPPWGLAYDELIAAGPGPS